MLQYLLNLTGIWLLSLVVFDLFLRKESYHGYNRLYLLTTLIAGIAIPLLQWNPSAHNNYYQVISRPVQQVITAKQSVAELAASGRVVSQISWLLLLYAAGATMATFLLLREVVKLITLYRKGTKSKEGRWTIIETGHGHSPFSLLDLLFVNRKKEYSNDEWQMVLEHEGKHSRLFHFADLILLRISQVVLWFHPLTYVYAKRLLLVHEYQADKVALQQPKVYGRFLAEQAVLHAAPPIAHSFNRSPIKKRIVMLTRKSTWSAKGKILLLAPLVLTYILCFSKSSFSQIAEIKDNILHYRGNLIEFVPQKAPGKLMLPNEKTGKEELSTVSYARPPIKLNGNKIYAPVEYNPDGKIPIAQRPVMGGGYSNLAAYVHEGVRKDLEQLVNGNYFFWIDDVLINEKGKIVYYENHGLFQMRVDIDEQKRIKDIVDKKITSLLDNAPTFTPAQYNGKPVPYLIPNIHIYSYGFDEERDLTVKDHKIIWDITTAPETNN